MKQYAPTEPHPVGLNNFVLASKDRVIYDFKHYKCYGTFPDYSLGASGNSVEMLVETVPVLNTVH